MHPTLILIIGARTQDIYSNFQNNVIRKTLCQTCVLRCTHHIPVCKFKMPVQSIQ